MANPRTVINPFTRNEERMRRNTRGTKWVTAGPLTGVRRNVYIEERTQERGNQEVLFRNHLHNGSLATRAPSSMRDETKPRPLSPKSSIMRTHVSRRDSPVSLPTLIEFSKPEQTWKKSDVTVVPHSSALTEWPGPKTKRTRLNQDSGEAYDTNRIISPKQTADQQQTVSSRTHWYRAAKDIYTAGPKGEGQKVWEAYQQALDHRNAEQKPLPTIPSEPVAKVKSEKQPFSPLPASPDGVLFPPLRPQPPQTRSGGGRKRHEKLCLRKDTSSSGSSYDAPRETDRTIQSTVDANDPLPLVPQLAAAPKIRQINDRPPENIRQNAEKEDAHSWWKHSPSRAPQSLKSKISHPGPLTAPNQGTLVNIAAECGGIGGPSAAVSHPITRTGAPLPQPPSIPARTKEAIQPSPRAFHLPIFHLSPSKSKRHTHEKATSRESDDAHLAAHWRDKLVGPAYEAGKSFKHTAMETLDSVHVGGRKKRLSDASFACRGNVDERLDRYQVREPLSGEEERDFVPEPLFYGRRRERDGGFY